MFLSNEIIIFGIVTNENNAKYNLKLPHITGHPYRVLIVGGFGLEKPNSLRNVIKEQDSDIDRIYAIDTYCY